MSNDSPRDDAPPSYAPTGPGGQSGDRLRWVLVVLAGLLATAGLTVGGFLVLLHAFNPVGDEWICSDGETPAGEAPSYNHCFRDGATLPAGFNRDPYGNRPMPYDCDKDGWMAVTRPATYPGTTGREDDCVRAGTDLPEGWSLREQG